MNALPAPAEAMASWRTLFHSSRTAFMPRGMRPPSVLSLTLSLPLAASLSLSLSPSLSLALSCSLCVSLFRRLSLWPPGWPGALARRPSRRGGPCCLQPSPARPPRAQQNARFTAQRAGEVRRRRLFRPGGAPSHPDPLAPTPPPPFSVGAAVIFRGALVQLAALALPLSVGVGAAAVSAERAANSVCALRPLCSTRPARLPIRSPNRSFFRPPPFCLTEEAPWCKRCRAVGRSLLGVVLVFLRAVGWMLFGDHPRKSDKHKTQTETISNVLTRS